MAVTVAWLAIYLFVVTVRETDQLWPITSFAMFARSPTVYVEYRLTARDEDGTHRRIGWGDLGTNFGSWESWVNHLVAEEDRSVADRQFGRLVSLVEVREGIAVTSLVLARDTYRLSDGELARSSVVVRWP